MRIALAADHAGFRTKARLARLLPARGHDIFDYGTRSEAPVDYPDFVHAASAAVAAGACDRGIVIGGSGSADTHLFRIENGKLRYVHTLTHLLQANFRGGGQRSEGGSQRTEGAQRSEGGQRDQ